MSYGKIHDKNWTKYMLHKIQLSDILDLFLAVSVAIVIDLENYERLNKDYIVKP